MPAGKGHSYRTIAVVLFGLKHISEWAWKTHDLRSRTIRLVQSVFALIHGGYLDLLRHGRKHEQADHDAVLLGVPKTAPLKIGIPLRRSTPPS